MPITPDAQPKEFITILLAVGLKMFATRTLTDADIFNEAEKFVDEAERRYGKLNPE